jgi:hypothetical protein
LPEPKWIVLRGELMCPTVGPFDTKEAAVDWQAADCAANGDCEWSVWELYTPAQVAAQL